MNGIQIIIMEPIVDGSSSRNIFKSEYYKRKNLKIIKSSIKQVYFLFKVFKSKKKKVKKIMANVKKFRSKNYHVKKD